MEPSSQNNEPVITQTEPWHAPLNRVTVLSKVTAAIVFITLPFVGFWVGMQYNLENAREEIIVTETTTVSPLSTQENAKSSLENDSQKAPTSTKVYPMTYELEGWIETDLGEYWIRYSETGTTDLEVLSRNRSVVTHVPWNTENIAMTGSEVLIGDINFDGILDVGLLNGVGRSGGVTHLNYDFYVYNQQTGALEFLLGLINPEFDTAAKKITEWQYSFEYVNGKPDTTKRVSETRVHRYVDGKYVSDEGWQKVRE